MISWQKDRCCGEHMEDVWKGIKLYQKCVKCGREYFKGEFVFFDKRIKSC